MQRYTRRIATCEKEIQIGKQVNSRDVNQWKYLLSLFTKLGPDGVSSDESGLDGDGNEVGYVRRLPWRADIEEHIKRVDYRGRAGIKGAKPMRRIRERVGRESQREACGGLPAALYDQAWLDQQTREAKKALCISSEAFTLRKFK